jgi:hypothetical protein
MANESNRKITDEQFQEGTTIDGDRIADAMEDVVDRLNSLPLKDLKRRYVKTQFVGGYSPGRSNNYPAAHPAFNAAVNSRGYMRQTPFMPSYNEEPIVTTAATTAWTGEVENKWRNKGTESFRKTAFINPTEYDLRDPQTWWTHETTMGFKKPVIITDISYCLFINNYYTGENINLEDGGEASTFGPNGEAFQWWDGAYADDIQVQIQVDDLWIPENRELTSVEMHKSNYYVYSDFTSAPVLYPQWSDAADTPLTPLIPAARKGNEMFPAVPAHARGIAGMWIEQKDIDIPISAKSRVHFTLIVPNYGTDLADTAPYGPQAPLGFHYSWCITVLEELEK